MTYFPKSWWFNGHEPHGRISKTSPKKTHRRKWQSFVNRAKGIYILGNYLQVINPKPSAQLLIIYIRLSFGQKGEKTTIKSQKGDSKELKVFWSKQCLFRKKNLLINLTFLWHFALVGVAPISSLHQRKSSQARVTSQSFVRSLLTKNRVQVREPSWGAKFGGYFGRPENYHHTCMFPCKMFILVAYEL